MSLATSLQKQAKKVFFIPEILFITHVDFGVEITHLFYLKAHSRVFLPLIFGIT